MSYRVEVAKTGRAGCQETECKKAGVKIDQGDLRFGIWVEIMGNGSWRWKHWGCITGKQLQNVRNSLDPDGTGNYQWDRLDGYDDEDKGSLHNQPELQEKVQRVITQGFIDPEDWKGDPEMNKLGESGIRTSETKQKIREEKKAREAEDQGLPPPAAQDETPKKKPTSKKRARAKEESDDEAAVEESKPAPKKRASKVKKEEADADGEPVEVKPKAKKGRKSAVKDEVDEQNGVEAPEAKPKAKRGAKKAVKEEAADEENGVVDTPEAKPKAKRGRKVAVKEEVVDEQNAVEAPAAKPKTAAKKGRKKAIKKEEAEVENGLEDEVKGEPAEASSSLSHITPAAIDDKAPKLEKEPSTAMELDVAEKPEADLEEKQSKKKGGRVKSGLSARSSRSRAASKK